MINDEFMAPPSVPYDDSPSAYQVEQEETRTNRRVVALEAQLRQLKAEIERKNTRPPDIGAPIPYTQRKYGDFSR